MNFRKLVLITHRWLGLASAAILSILGASGAIMAWPWPAQSRIRRIAGPLHVELAMGRIGHWIVLVSTIVAVIIMLGGLVLWAKRKIVLVRTNKGWYRTMFDLHHSLGVLGFVLMFILAVTGIAIAIQSPKVKMAPAFLSLHTTRDYPYWLKFVYTLGTTAFVIMSLTGIVMWWKSRGAGDA